MLIDFKLIKIPKCEYTYNNLLSQWFKPKASSMETLELDSTVCVCMQLQGIL